MRERERKRGGEREIKRRGVGRAGGNANEMF